MFIGRGLIALGMLTACAVSANAGVTIHVDPNDSIQEAIDQADDGDEIVVAPGTYYETLDMRGRAITLRSSDGPEVTIIDGQQDGPVIVCDREEGPDTVIKGFTITNGDDGSGMYIDRSSPTVIDCVFRHCRGSVGGAVTADRGSPVLIRCNFSGNTADFDGGGLYCYRGSPQLLNCSFSENAASRNGGAMASDDSHPTLTNCIFRGNSAGEGGGAITYYGASTLTMMNCTLVGNRARLGGAIWSTGDGFTMANSIVWANAAPSESQIDLALEPNSITYSCIEGGWPGIGNIQSNPLLDLSLRPLTGSPCIDAGNNAAVPADLNDLDGDGDISEQIPLDAFGLLRFHDDPLASDVGVGPAPIVDMGASESEAAAPPQPATGDVDHDGDVDAIDFQHGVACLILSGPDIFTWLEDCQAVFDFDADTDVDLHDVVQFQLRFTGPQPQP